MAESEKMTALKKAYAEMILNTAKEAAVRVLASEKRMLRFQQDLLRANEEALRLLLRLKQITDAKIIEAEIRSSSQQSRIDVLEAQLQEAEGVIVDLREELKWVRDKLQKVRNEQTKPLNGKITESELPNPIASSVPITNSLSNSGVQTVATFNVKRRALGQGASDKKCCHTKENTEQLLGSLFENDSSVNSDLAPIITEAESYSSRYPHRVPPLKRNLMPADSPAREVVELFKKPSDKDGRKCSKPSPKIKKKKRTSTGEEIRRRGKLQALQKRKAQFRRCKAKCRNYPSQLMKSNQPPSTLNSCRRLSVNENVKLAECLPVLPCIKAANSLTKKSSSEQEEEIQRDRCFVDDQMIAHEEIRERKEQNGSGIPNSPNPDPDQHTMSCQLSSLVYFSKAHPFSLHGNVNSSEDQSNGSANEVKLKLFPRLDPGLTLIKGGANSISGSKGFPSSVKVLNRSTTIQNDTEVFGLADELLKQEDAATSNSKDSCLDINSDLINLPVIYSGLKDARDWRKNIENVSVADFEDVKKSEGSNVSRNQEDSDLLLRCNFQRKRKNEALCSPDQTGPLEMDNAKRRAGEKQIVSPKQHISSLVNESSKDSWLMSQIARQLISLSGKKWWQ
ncbi:hypothetical protein K2173_014129 [Erythroxylum novogranatense]|uniref:Uncharacterized protein n=1 Tax=Erythroxylum novogranatense TaxID=1862640 RepID=A0AAV8SDV0_9ROSI|nr:hypothetical protein K2173_014129 [Erythroxylum novogranatense]